MPKNDVCKRCFHPKAEHMKYLGLEGTEYWGCNKTVYLPDLYDWETCCDCPFYVEKI